MFCFCQHYAPSSPRTPFVVKSYSLIYNCPFLEHYISYGFIVLSCPRTELYAHCSKHIIGDSNDAVNLNLIEQMGLDFFSDCLQ